MNHTGNKLLRNVVLTVCMFLCCLAVICGIAFLPSYSGRSGATVELPTESNSAANATAYRDYTEIRSVTVGGDVKFYNHVSTGAGIKQNLEVTAVYNGQTVRLSPDEFYVTNEQLGEIDLLDFDVNPQTLTVTVNAGTLKKDVVIHIEEALPAYTSVKVTALGAVPDDCDALSVKRMLEVVGTLSDGTTENVNKELYDVSLPALTAGRTATATLSFSGGIYGNTESVSLSVRRAAVIGVSVGVKPELKLVDGYYKNGDVSAFVHGMPNFAASGTPSVMDSLNVYVYYDNGREAAVFDAEGKVTLQNAAAKNSTAEVANQSSGSQNTVSVTLRLSDGSAFSDSISLPFENRIITDIDPQFSLPIGMSEVYSYTEISELVDGISVVPIYNDGTYGNAITDNFDYNGAVTPTSTQLELHIGEAAGWKYDKDIYVSYTTQQGKTITRPVTVRNIVYVAPDGISSSITRPSVSNQTLTYAFDYSGFYFTADYDDGNYSNNIYLTDISDSSAVLSRSVEYYDSTNTVIPSADGTVPKGAVRAKITVNYGSMTAATTRFAINTMQAPVAYPTASEFVKDYDENCVITLSGVNEYMVVRADSDDVQIGAVNAEKKTVDIKFTSGGMFDVSVVLMGDVGHTQNGSDGVYRFENVIGESNIESEGLYVVTYHFTVNKGKFDLSLDYGEDNGNTWVYGEAPTAPTLNGTLGGKTYTIENTENSEGLASDVLAVPYKLYYYGWNNRTYDDIEGVAYEEIDTTVPTDVGEYYVVAVTKENNAFASSVTYRWNARIVSITQKPLTGSIIKSPTYDRDMSYKAVDVVQTSEFAYNHKATDVVSVSASGAPFVHAGTYNITVAITNANYKWADGVTTEADKVTVKTTFKISARKLGFKVSLSGFTYGDTAIDLHPSFTYDDSGNGTYTSAKNKFYAVVGSPKYYAADSSGNKTGNAIDTASKPMSGWAAGNYVAEYTTSLGSGDKTGDYNLPTAKANFSVRQKTLTAVSFSTAIGSNTVYTSKAHKVTIKDFDGAFADGETAGDVFTVTIEGKRHNGTAVGASRTDDTVSLTEAGVYSITVKLKSKNYKWSNGTTDDIKSDTYTIKQAVLTVNGTDDKVFNYDGDAKSPVLSLSGITGHSFGLTTKIYTASDCAADSEISADDVKEVGTYYIRIESFTCTTVNKANYRLPDPHVYTFNITAAGLDKPTLLAPYATADNALSVEFDGSVFDIGAFIDKWKDDYQVAGADKLNVSVYAGDTTAALRDVYYSGNEVAAYKVYLYPKTNYKWNDGVETVTTPDDVENAYVIDFTITRLEAEIAWSDTAKVYSGEAQFATVSVTNAKGEDKVGVSAAFKKNGAVVAEAKNAGTYTVYASALSGDQSGNYKISESNANYSESFVIAKQTIDYPVLPSGEYGFSDVGKIDVSSQGFDYAKYKDVLDISVTGTIPESWWVNAPAEQKDGNVSGASFDTEKGTFLYVRAAEYSFTCSITDYSNYCWENDKAAEAENFERATAYVYTPDAKATVKRAELIAPNISAKRAQEWDSTVAIDFGSAISGVAYGVMYGESSDAEPTSATWLGLDTEGNGIRGIYYAELTVSATYPLNYVWVENTDDLKAEDNGLGYVDEYATFYYRDGKVAVRLYYAITSSQLDVDLFVNNYTFGDNGYNGSAAFDKADALGISGATVVIVGADASLAVAETAKANTVVFTDSDGNTVTELVNGLPWNADTYTVSGTLEFGNGEVYQPKKFSVTFTVYARDISVVWNDLSLEYNADKQMASADIDVTVKKTEDDSTDYTDGLTAVVGLVGGGDDPVNADTYEVCVSDINGDENAKKNFKIPEAGLTERFTITAKSVTVKGIAVAAHVYGDEIADSEKKADTSVFFNDGAANFAEVKICDGEGAEIGRYAAVGTYFVTVGWKSNAGVHAVNYDVDFDNTAEFKVIARRLTVALNAQNAKSGYGDAVDLYAANKPIYDVTSCNGKGDELADKTAEQVFSFACDASATSAVGSYPVTTSAADANFDIEFVGEWKYVIGNAAITDKDGTVAGTNGVYNAQEQNVLANGYTVQTKNNQAAVWYYGAVGSADAVVEDVENWTPFTVSPTVYDVGKYYYYVKVTATYHDDFYKLVTVNIQKAELEVSVKLTIKYGEQSPADVGYKTSLAELRTTAANGGVYTVGGFKGDDKAKFYSDDGFYELSGTVAYTTSYTVGKKADVYSLMFDGALKCKNYSFKAVAGVLTVEKINISVAITDKTAVYNGTMPDLAGVVTLPKSTYAPAADITLPDDDTYADIFELSSDAFTKAGNAVTNVVGDYAVNGTNLKPQNYEITFSGSWTQGATAGKAGTYRITPAALDIALIADYSGKYDEAYHGLNVTFGGNATDVLATANDGTEPTVRFYIADRYYDRVTAADLVGMTGVSEMPKFIDAGKYYVCYSITANNYSPVYGCKRITIDKADNYIVTEFKFANDRQVSGTDESVLAGENTEAWVYGLRSASCVDGYDKNGGQKTFEPKAAFTRDAGGVAGGNKLVIELYYIAEIGGAEVRIATDFVANSVADMFAYCLANKLFDAGYYRLRATMEGTDNYYRLETDNSWVFKVAKRKLSVTAEDMTDGEAVVFGTQKSQLSFVGVYDGLALNSTASGATVDTIADALGGTPVFVTDYVTGSEVGKGSLGGGMYYIRVDGQSEYSPRNYSVTFTDAELEVVTRGVTIKIDDKQNTYNLQGDSGKAELTFAITGDVKFYGVSEPSDGVYTNANQEVLRLKTAAFDNTDPEIATNNVILVDGVERGYTIYAVYASEYYARNYTVMFEGCSATETADADAIAQSGKNNAGSFVIKRANFSIDVLGVHHIGKNGVEVQGEVYSGAVNYYKAEFHGNPNIKIEFEYYKRNASGAYVSIDDDQVVGVGSYRADGHATSDNYYNGNASFVFTIRAAKLTLTAAPTSIQYGSPLNDASVADGRFDGFEYDAASETMLDDVIEAYITDNKVTYTSDNYTVRSGVGAYRITPVCASTANVTVEAKPAELKCLKRDVVVTVNGYADGNTAASCYYLGTYAATQNALATSLAANYAAFLSVPNDAFGKSGDSYSALKVSASLPNNAVEVKDGGYGMAIASTAENYNVYFVTALTAEGVMQKRIEHDADDAPTFMINKARLTVYANDRRGGVVEGYSVVYGSRIPLTYGEQGGMLDYDVSGMQNGESFDALLTAASAVVTYTVKCNAKNYEAWLGYVSEKYTVAVVPFGEIFKNYTVADYVTAELAVTPRPVSASTADQMFCKAADGYHGGVYGKSHDAQITFTGLLSGVANAENINVKYRPSYTLVYDTKAVGSYQQAGKAPVTVGNWNVTVKLAAGGNYVFDDDAYETKLPFNVTKREISQADLLWEKSTVVGEEESENYIVNYIDDIMRIDSFMFSSKFSAEDGYPIEEGDPATATGDYRYIGANGELRVHIAGNIGKYTVNFRLRDTAVNNYVLISSNDLVVISSFDATADNVVMTVSVAGWTYRDTPNTPTVTIGGVTVTGNVTFTYGKITDVSGIAEYIEREQQAGFGGFDRSEISALSYDSLKTNVEFTAGYYVLCAYYQGDVAQSKYYIFEVEKRIAQIPEVASQVYTFNGGTQSIELMFDVKAMRAVFDGNTVQTDDGAIFYAVNAGTYTVRFYLFDAENYEFASDCTVVNNAAEYNWNIRSDDSEGSGGNGVSGGGNVISVPTQVSATYGKDFDRSVASVKSGYNGVVTWYYAAKLGSVAPDVSANVWTLGVPAHAGEYWLKAVLSDGNKNFTDKYTISAYTVSPKSITASATGTLIYGDDFDTGVFRYTVNGLEEYDHITESDIGYETAQNYGRLQAGGEYYVRLKTDVNGVVVGLSAGSDYIIRAAVGRLTVNKRGFTVTVGSLSSDYTVAPDVSYARYTVDGLAAGDKPSDLKLKFETDATADSAADGEYWITVKSFDNPNYELISYARGAYKVNRLRISVALSAQTDAVFGNKNIVGATMGEIACGNPAADIAKVRAELTLTFRYYGMTYGNVAYDDDVAPTQAGEYTALLVGVNDNYILEGSPSVEFTVKKREVDASAVSVLKKTYNGSPIAPVISDDVNDKSLYIYDTTAHTDAESYAVRVTLVDPANYVWAEVGGDAINVEFVIERTDNGLVGELTIADWQYGAYDASANAPHAAVVSGGNIQFRYSADGVTFGNVAPETGNVGEYYVLAYVPQSKNYNEFTSDPVKFEITRFVLTAPTLTVVQSGKDKNDVFTGGDLASAIVGFDPLYMQIAYDGRVSVAGGSVTVYARDAKIYTVTVSLLNSRNYRWSAECDPDDDGAVELTWTVARKKIAKPTANSERYIVNGSLLEYIPIGYDPSIMAISDNAYSYGGSFKAKVTLKDTSNYEWSDGSTDAVVIRWSIVGADSVFTAVISVLSVLAGIAAAGVLVQVLLFIRKKRITASAMQEIENSGASGNDDGGDNGASDGQSGKAEKGDD